MVLRLTTTAVLAASLTLVLAGCGSSAAPAALAPTVSGPAQTQQPTVDPSLEGAAESPTAASPEAEVEAAVRAYVAALNNAMSTGDVRDLQARTSPDCTCASVVNEVIATYAAGQRTPEAAWAVSDLRVPSVSSGEAFAVFDVLQSPYRRLSESGRTIESVPAVKLAAAMRLTDGAGDWRVADVDFL